MSYLNNDGTLKDEKVASDIRKAADMYENGEIVEAHSLLIKITNTLQDFENEQ